MSEIVYAENCLVDSTIYPIEIKRGDTTLVIYTLEQDKKLITYAQKAKAFNDLLELNKRIEKQKDSIKNNLIVIITTKDSIIKNKNFEIEASEKEINNLETIIDKKDKTIAEQLAINKIDSNSKLNSNRKQNFIKKFFNSDGFKIGSSILVGIIGGYLIGKYL